MPRAKSSTASSNKAAASSNKAAASSNDTVSFSLKSTAADRKALYQNFSDALSLTKQDVDELVFTCPFDKDAFNKLMRQSR